MMDVLFWIKFSWLRVEPALTRLYIIGLIVARIYADYFLSNIVEYFGDILMLSAPYAAKIINIRDGLAGIFGVIGALILDLYLTHHGMTFLASIFYVVGLSVVTYGDTKRGITRENMVFTGFFLTGVGKYSLRNSSDALADEKDPDNLNNPFKNLIKLFRGSDSRILRFLEFHEHVILMVFVKYGTKIAVIAVSTIVNLKLKRLADEAEKWWNGKFLIPTIGFALVTFVSLFYSKSFVKPYEKRGTPLKNVIRVFVAAILKRHHPLHQHPMEEALYEETAEHSLKHTNSLRFLDKAAIVESTQPEEERRKWRLSTLREVEETKRMLHMVPMCTTFLAYGMVKSIGNTFFFQQGNFMDSTLGHLNLELPLQTLLLLSDISSAGIKGLFTLTLSKKLQGVGKKYTSPIKYAIGLILATFCCTVAAWIANDKGKADESVFWLTPQFILFGAMSGITRDAIEGFFHDQLPPSMMRYDSVLTDAMIGVGAIFSVALVHANNYFPITERALGNSGGSKLDLAHLSRFYRLTTVVSFIILSVYTFVATRFHYQDYKEDKQNEENQEAVA